MKTQAIRMLDRGRNFTDPVMYAHGFVWEPLDAGDSSGGSFASGRYVKQERSLELSFHFSLGLVTYHIGDLSIGHEEYMRQCAPNDNVRYPGFSQDPLDGFRDLAHDLRAYGSDFLDGSGEQLRLARVAADGGNRDTGFSKLTRV